MRISRNQAGFLAIVALLLLLFVGIVGTLAANLFVHAARGTAEHLHATEAFYNAESKLSDQYYTLFSRPISTLQHAISETRWTLMYQKQYPIPHAGTLSIDREIMNYRIVYDGYYSILYIRPRGILGTQVLSHLAGTPLFLHSATVTVTGEAGSAQRTLQATLYRQTLWAISNKQILKSDRDLQTFTEQFSTQRALYSIHFSDPGHGWAVGESQGNQFGLYRYDGQNWQLEPVLSAEDFVPTGKKYPTLTDVFTQRLYDAWIVGTIAKGKIDKKKVERETIIHCETDTQGYICRWTKIEPADPINLYAVYAIIPSEVYAAGERGELLYFNGKQWSMPEKIIPTAPDNLTLTDFFWRQGALYALGETATQSLLFVRTGVNQWQAVSTPPAWFSIQMDHVLYQSDNDVYAHNGRGWYHYNGTRWEALSNWPAITDIDGWVAPNNKPVDNWQEIFFT